MGGGQRIRLPDIDKFHGKEDKDYEMETNGYKQV